MAVETPTYISCPNCHQTLPSGTPRCQFCGHTIASGGPIGGRGVLIISDQHGRKRDGLSWKEYGYIVCSCLIVLSGIYDILAAFGFVEPAVTALGGQAYFGVLGAFRIGLGLALLAQQAWAQFMMKWLCILGALATLRGMMMGMMFSTPRHPYGALNILFDLAQLAVQCFTIYFILDLADV